YFEHRGVPFPRLLYSPRGLEAAREFAVEDDDIFNVTYPKSGDPSAPAGTVWMLEILSLILSDGDPRWCRSVPNWERGPWLETLGGLRRARGTPRPRLISSHLPVQLFPRAAFGSSAKVGPLGPGARRSPQAQGGLCGVPVPTVPFGSWFDHVQGWLQLLGSSNFFCISYEELQQDLRGSVERLCSFLGRRLSAAALDAVVANSSFGAMRGNPMSNFSRAPLGILDLRRGPFLRKGISGDWKNHLTPEQSLRFDRLCRQRLAGLGGSFPWDPPPHP
ncbi:ST2B1 Sulfotransferase, partial [Rhinopomastus cyanomelas]|nr:ST2B1 Sulfotransferase [Rhinopomastus cyanomelas]